MASTAPLDFDSLDYYAEPRLIDDPNPYFEHLRAKGPVTPLPMHGVVAVTGFEEAVQVYTDVETYSSVNAVTGPFPPVPFAIDGGDITDQIEAWRPDLPMKDQIVSFDQPRHSPARSLMMRLFTPSRLKQNEAFLWTLSDQLIDRFWASGEVEIVRDYGVPFAGMVIADLLGVPEEDRPGFAERFGVGGSTNLPSVEGGHNTGHNPLVFLHGAFSEYLADRRREPRQDILSDLANGKFPDGSTPDLQEVVNVATFMFGAGQDTTARLLAGAMQVLAENPDLQQRMRAGEGALMDEFVEEILRLEGPVKTSHRLVKKRTVLGGVELAPGTHVALMNGAINRDPRRFEDPNAFRLDRPKAKEHIGFGRGAHTCPGAPLARTETRVSLTRLLARMDDIRVSDEHHGPPGQRAFHHEPTYILRGLVQLHLQFTPRDG
jgi:cytochrome P450